MRAVALPRVSALVLIASCVLFAGSERTAPAPPPSNLPAQAQPQHPGALLRIGEPAQQPAKLPQASGPDSRPPDDPKVAKSPAEEAWRILDKACTGDRWHRVAAISVLGLLPDDSKALKITEDALAAGRPEERVAAAVALGEMKARPMIPKLIKALDDKDPTVVLAAAHSLFLMQDDSAYHVYYEVLTGRRKARKGVIATEESTLRDPKKMAKLGFQEGLSFAPFAGIGWSAITMIREGDPSPLRAAAAKALAKDPDPEATTALTNATGDKHWLVRVAALAALAKRGDPSVIDTVELRMSDEKPVVRYTAAAAVLRLLAIQASPPAVTDRIEEVE